MDMVSIRAAVSAHGLRKGQEVTVAETPVIAGGIDGGVFILLRRVPSQTETEFVDELVDAITTPAFEPDDPTHIGDERPVPEIQDVPLPDSTDDGETPATEYQPEGKRRRG